MIVLRSGWLLWSLKVWCTEISQRRTAIVSSSAAININAGSFLVLMKLDDFISRFPDSAVFYPHEKNFSSLAVCRFYLQLITIHLIPEFPQGRRNHYKSILICYNTDILLFARSMSWGILYSFGGIHNGVNYNPSASQHHNDDKHLRETRSLFFIYCSVYAGCCSCFFQRYKLCVPSTRILYHVFSPRCILLTLQKNIRFLSFIISCWMLTKS